MVTATGIAPGSEMTAQMEQVEERNVSGVLHVAAIFGSHMVLQLSLIHISEPTRP